MRLTLLQARWSAVFLSVSCRARSALALLTNTSVADEWTVLCLEITVLWCTSALEGTDPQHWSVHLELPSWAAFCGCLLRLCSPLLRGSGEERDTPRGQKKLQREGGSWTHTPYVRLRWESKSRRWSFAKTWCHLNDSASLYLPLESVMFTIDVPSESINISATPSLSVILE